MAIVVGWLVRKTLNTAPWVEQRTVDMSGRDGALALLPVQVGLGVFLAVATSLFALADHRLSHANDGGGLDEPRSAEGAVAQYRGAGPRERRDAVDARCGKTAARSTPSGRALSPSGVFSFALPRGAGLGVEAAQRVRTFHCGQSGVSPSSCCSPRCTASMCWAVWRSGRARRCGPCATPTFARVRLSVELCTVYWHFLLVVWAALFASVAVQPSLKGIEGHDAIGSDRHRRSSPAGPGHRRCRRRLVVGPARVQEGAVGQGDDVDLPALRHVHLQLLPDLVHDGADLDDGPVAESERSLRAARSAARKCR